MSITNTSKPTTSIGNSSKVSVGETWASIDSTWFDEERTWLVCSQLIGNTSKPQRGLFVTKSVGTATNTDGGGGTGTDPWLNPTNALAQDGTYTACTLSSNLDNSDYLDLTNFGFEIPSTATILGIKVEYDVYASATGVREDMIRLIKGGTAQGTNKSDEEDWPLALRTERKGSSGDLWGSTFTPAEINATDFGVRFQILRVSSTSGRTGYLDNARITVYYDDVQTFTNQAKP